jgi:hypothetical protein
MPLGSIFSLKGACSLRVMGWTVVQAVSADAVR